MFTKQSRYYYLYDVYAVDSQDRRHRSKSLRLTPSVLGVMNHSVEGVDRLDNLAFKYYRIPTRWWRICDANPKILSPLELLDGGPLISIRISLSHDDSSGPPRWSALIQQLRISLGVDDVQIKEDVSELMAAQEDIGTETVEYLRSAIVREVVIRFNRYTTDAQELMSIIDAAGFEAGTSEPIERIGKNIALPPRTLGG